MISGHLYIFLYLSHVILFFPKHSNFRCFDVIHEEIKKIGKARHLKTCEDFGKIKNEDFRGLRRHYRGNFLFPDPKTSYMEANTQNDEETHISSIAMCLTHGVDAWSMKFYSHMRLEHVMCLLSMAKNGPKLVFATF